MSDATEILIVDDNKNNLLSLRGLIEKYFKYVNVIQANSGITALSILMKKTVDLIILDIQMPKMDGFETAKILQSRSRTQSIPIIFLTAAYKSEEFKKKGFDVGATDYLTKPIDSKELTSKINLYLRFVQKYQIPPTQEKTQESSEENQSLEEYRIGKIRTSLNRIIAYSDVLKEEATKLGYEICLPEVEKVSDETKQVQKMFETFLTERQK